MKAPDCAVGAAARRRVAFACAVITASSIGCSPVTSSGVRTGGAGLGAHQGPVGLSATNVPPGAVEVGIAQAVGIEANIGALVPQFAGQVAALGGNFGLVERVQTEFEMVTRTENYSYSCGTTQYPRTCYGTRTVTNEVATTQMVGRAFYVEGLVFQPAAPGGGGP
ncbi:MAG: hypothetical protein HY907_13305 [Deltaproteobacteria bacterium]|nr:hypothetical protein [Deltaproteobacteria bacterium]